MFAVRTIFTFCILLMLVSTPAFAEPLTNLGEPTTYCSEECSAKSLALVPQFDQLVERCEAGDAEACFDASTMRLGSPYCCAPSLTVDRVWALKTMKKACDLGHDEACWQLYVVLTPWMDNLAKDNAERGCQASLGYACYVQGSWPLMPEGGDELRRKACALGDPNGCALAYVNVACGAQTLPGVSPADARQKLKYSCDAYLSPKWQRLRAKDMGAMVEDNGCAWLADELKVGQGGPTDWNKARWLDHYLCRESGRCSPIFPFRTIGGVAMASEVSLLALGLSFWRWPRTRRRLEEKISPVGRKRLGHVAAAILALVGLQLVYCAWGIAAWIA